MRVHGMTAVDAIRTSEDHNPGAIGKLARRAARYAMRYLATGEWPAPPKYKPGHKRAGAKCVRESHKGGRLDPRDATIAVLKAEVAELARELEEAGRYFVDATDFPKSGQQTILRATAARALLARLGVITVAALLSLPAFAAATPKPSPKAPVAKCEPLNIAGKTVWAKPTKSGWSTAACEPKITFQVGTVGATGFEVTGKTTAQRCTVKVAPGTLTNGPALVKATQACVDAMAAANGM